MKAEFKNPVVDWIHTKGWATDIILIFFVAMLLHSILGQVYRRLYPRLKRTRVLWDDSLLYAVHRPLIFFIWFLAMTFSLQFFGSMFDQGLLFRSIEPLRDLGGIVLMGWALMRFVGQMEQRVIQRGKKNKEPVDKTTVHAVCQLVRAVILILIGLVGMQTLGISISILLAFGGVGGIAVAFAAKDLLGNFFGGLMIYLDRPFTVGDWIKSPDKEIEGTVEHIGWRLTRIRTFDKCPLYVPNGMFSSISVVNPSRMHNRRIKTTIGLRYEDANKIADILKDLNQMLKKHPEIDQDQTLMVNFTEFADSSLNIQIYVFTKSTVWKTYLDIQEDVFLKALSIIDNHGAECAFPTRTVHMSEA